MSANWDGSLTSEAYAEVITKNRLWFHVTPRENVRSIKEFGLVGDMESRRSDALASRPGCTYLMWADSIEWCYEMADLDQVSGALLAVDMAGIERWRIVPDEDEWTSTADVYSPVEYGIEPWDVKSGESSGAWADRVRLGSQPGTADLAFRSGRCAVLGTIPPHLVIPAHRRVGEWTHQMVQRLEGVLPRM